MFIDRADDFAPNLEIHILADFYRLVVFVFRDEKNSSFVINKKFFDAHLVADAGDDDIARLGFNREKRGQRKWQTDAGLILDLNQLKFRYNRLPAMENPPTRRSRPAEIKLTRENRTLLDKKPAVLPSTRGFREISPLFHSQPQS